ncbi:hypothetical protein AC739_02925 [Planococcus glaciei]|uniref:hypothetical protein n=1 Tax=Planococcus glaciei TaxID=459472 RepID=UPI00069DDF13|nr:hypothetical protein [Planococcus glaciei]KOF11784.1 hypothetical protein AC739_02925 [Planococcus glaciei]
MIRILFFLIIAAVVLAIAFTQFKAVSPIKKAVLAGGSLGAAAIALLLQNTISWYLALLSIVAVSLVASIAFVKISEKEEIEKKRLAEEQKARRQELISSNATLKVPGKTAAAAETEADNVTEVIKEREKINTPEKIFMPETVKMPNLNKEPEKEPEREKELVGAKPYSMQSIKPVGKEDQGE